MTAEMVALLGPEGTFSDEAVQKLFPDHEKVFCNTIGEVFERIIEGKASYGVVPVENSLEGSVASTLEMLLKEKVKICRELVLDIKHCLLALPGTELSEINEVLSHPHALAQCRDFIKSLNAVGTRNYPSTAEAAAEVASKRLKNSAAIASKIAGKLYGLQILREGISDQEKNQTRFFVLSKKCPQAPVEAKTSIVLGLKDRPGALFEILAFFAREHVNLTKIESRPSKKSLGDYIFYIDFIGDHNNRKIKAILSDVKDNATFFKILGSYSTDR